MVQSAADYCRCVTLWKALWSSQQQITAGVLHCGRRCGPVNNRLLQVCYIVEDDVVHQQQITAGVL